MLTEKQIEMWDAITSSHPTADSVMVFFVKYCGTQILDDTMWEYLRRNEYLTSNESAE